MRRFFRFTDNVYLTFLMAKLGVITVAILVGSVFVFICGGFIGIVSIGMFGVFVIDGMTAVPVAATITSHQWKRSITQEELKMARYSDECADVPTSAHIVSQTTKFKSGRSIAWCTYETLKWTTVDTKVAQGTGLSPAPAWPTVPADHCDTIGCRRPGKQEESYTLNFHPDKGGDANCTVQQVTWARYADAARVYVSQGGITGYYTCNKL